MGNVETAGAHANSQDFQAMRFDLNSLSAEVGVVKKAFSAQRLQSLDNMETAVVNLTQEIEVLKMAAENYALCKDLSRLENKLKEYTPLRQFKELQEEKDDMVNKVEFNQLTDEFSFLK